MNERIKELADQAAWTTRMAHNNAYWRMQDEIAEDITWREKFAEMIVRECARVGFNAAYPYKGVVVLKAIKERFGLDQ